jgi:hypothetical protein
VTASATGYFVFRGGLSGEYRLLAVEALPPGGPQNPAFVEQFVAYGRSVFLNTAGSTTIQLNRVAR